MAIPLFDYDIVDKKWVVNPTEAEIVKDVFNRYRNGEKGKSIIDRLNAQGIKPKNSNKFTMSSICRMIRNEKHIGIVTVNETTYTDVVPPIVDKRIFKECNFP